MSRQPVHFSNRKRASEPAKNTHTRDRNNQKLRGLGEGGTHASGGRWPDSQTPPARCFPWGAPGRTAGCEGTAAAGPPPATGASPSLVRWRTASPPPAGLRETRPLSLQGGEKPAVGPRGGQGPRGAASGPSRPHRPPVRMATAPRHRRSPHLLPAQHPRFPRTASPAHFRPAALWATAPARQLAGEREVGGVAGKGAHSRDGGACYAAAPRRRVPAPNARSCAPLPPLVSTYWASGATFILLSSCFLWNRPESV